MAMRVTLLVQWVVLPVSLVVGLAALLRMAGPLAGEADGLKSIIRLPLPVTWLVDALFVLAAVVLVVGLARRVLGRRRSGEGELLPESQPMPAWMRTLTQMLSLANAVLIAYLIWRGVIPLTELLAFGRGAVSAIGGPSMETPGAAPALWSWTFGALAIVAALAAVTLALWVAFGDRLAEWWMRRDEVASASSGSLVAEPLADPRAEPDPRRAIMRCYASFERVAAGSGVTRHPWLTPQEFMREALRRLAAPRGAVPTLTSLFELARFSHRALGPAERGRALEALNDITAAQRQRGAGAAP
jgi:hypothetical protein